LKIVDQERTLKMSDMKRKLPWDLIISKLRGNLSPENTTDFNDWMDQDDNRQLFQQLEIVWKHVQNKTASYEPDVEFYWRELSARMEKESTKTTDSTPAPQKTKHIPIRRLYRIAVAASILLAITFSGAYYLGRNKSWDQPITQTYASITGKSKVILPDGSEVWLHNNTTLSYVSNFNGDTREVKMNGEAFFNVRHNDKKPFIVNVDGIKVLVHGTKFNVNAYPASKEILVSLFEGAVSMTAGHKEVSLKPGFEGSYDKLNNSISTNAGDVEFAKSWTHDQLRFENKNLRYVCKYLSKWYSVNIDIDPAISNHQSYTFTLRHESLEEVVRILARIHSMEYQFDENNYLKLTKKRN